MSLPVRVFCPAKINLTLKVLGRRGDGYHEIETIMQSISLQDVLNITWRREGLEVVSKHPKVPPGEENLVYKAAHLLQQRYAPAAGAAIDIEKNIPLAAGLAGGSTDAAGAIRGLNYLWGLKLTPGEMLEVASQVGSDVAFCLQGGTALAKGRGEQVFPLRDLTDRWLVVVRPPLEVSTASVYQAYQPSDSEAGRHTQEVLKAVETGDMGKIAESLFNDLEKVTLRWYPEIEAIKQEFRANGVPGALMSGSGPTVFGVVDSLEWAHWLVERFQRRYPESYAVCTLPSQELEIF